MICPPTTSWRGLDSIEAIWSGGMSQAKSKSPARRPFTREATSGTSTKRSRLIGGRPPQYSSNASITSSTSGLYSTMR